MWLIWAKELGLNILFHLNRNELSHIGLSATLARSLARIASKSSGRRMWWKGRGGFCARQPGIESEGRCSFKKTHFRKQDARVGNAQVIGVWSAVCSQHPHSQPPGQESEGRVLHAVS